MVHNVVTGFIARIYCKSEIEEADEASDKVQSETCVGR